MSRRGFRVVVAGLSFVAWFGTATAWAEEPPESPPPAFVAPPPGYEPPTSQGPTYVPTEPPPASTGEIPPTLLTLDRMDAHSRLGLQIGFDKLDDFSLSDLFVMRFDPYAQYVFPGKGGGIYAQLPIAHAFVEGDDSTGYGNLEMGGFFLPMHSNDLILRVGLAAATASDDDGAVANAIAVYERLTDLALAIPNYTTVRVSASTVQQVDQWFFRADGGFDLAIDHPSGTDDPSVFFRANVAAGIRLPGVDLAVELANLAFVNGTVDGGITGRFNHTAAISARTTGENQLHIGTVFPLDSPNGTGPRGELWILSLGYQRAFY